MGSNPRPYSLCGSLKTSLPASELRRSMVQGGNYAAENTFQSQARL